MRDLVVEHAWVAPPQGPLNRMSGEEPPMCDEERRSPTGSRWKDTSPRFMECWPAAPPCQALEEDHLLLAL